MLKKEGDQQRVLAVAEPGPWPSGAEEWSVPGGVYISFTNPEFEQVRLNLKDERSDGRDLRRKGGLPESASEHQDLTCSLLEKES